MDSTTQNNSGVKKKFKPEYVTQVLIGGAIIYGLYLAVPVLLGALHGAVILGILGAILSVVFGIGQIGGGIKRLITTAFVVGTRALTSAFVKVNPWAIVKNHIQSMKKSREEMDEQITSLNEAVSNNEMLIEKNTGEMKDAKEYGMKEIQKGNKDGARVHANQVGRLDTFNKKLIQLTTKMRYLLGFLEKLHEKVGYSITDMENDLNIQEREYKSLLAGTNAFQKAMSIYKGNADELELKNMAIEEIETKIGNFRGQIDKALRDSSKFMANMDTMDEVNIDRGLKLLENFDDSQYDNILMQLNGSPVATTIQVNKNQASKYGSFLSKDSTNIQDVKEEK